MGWRQPSARQQQPSRMLLFRLQALIPAGAAGRRNDRRFAATRRRLPDVRIDVGRTKHPIGAGQFVAEIFAGRGGTCAAAIWLRIRGLQSFTRGATLRIDVLRAILRQRPTPDAKQRHHSYDRPCSHAHQPARHGLGSTVRRSGLAEANQRKMAKRRHRPPFNQSDTFAIGPRG
jgi:hypothetical protein